MIARAIPYLGSVAVAGLLAAAGVLALFPRAEATGRQSTDIPDSGGVIYALDGVGGADFTSRVVTKTFREAGVRAAIRRFDWSHGFGRWHADLTDDENLRARATELAALIAQRKARWPDSPVHIIAKSGGTAVALMALDQLPPSTVERVVLLAPAVSPAYDLAPALRAVRTEMVSFWSPRDRLVLGVGTSIFGTAGGEPEDSAGYVGFDKPGEATREAYLKLRQIEWTPEMAKSFNFGTHLGPSMPAFVREYVAPLFLDEDRPAGPAAGS
jgi:pimeloyl-ACP methyl ester carboxylesterase